jgi:hypothetical protein
VRFVRSEEKRREEKRREKFILAVIFRKFKSEKNKV